MSTEKGWGAAVQSAVEAEDWQPTLRLAVLMMARYGPHTALGILVLRTADVLGHHLGL